MDDAVSNADAVVEGSLKWSFLTGDDLPDLADLREAIDYFDDPLERRDLPSLRRDFERDVHLDGYRATVGRDSGGTVVAYAWIHPSVSPELSSHVWLDVGVHPAARHRRIGRRLIDWCANRARDWHASAPRDEPLWLGYLVDEKFTGLRGALSDAGFTPQRWYFDAHLQFDDHAVPPLPVVPGVRLVHYDPALSEPVRVAHNAIHGVLPGAKPYTRADWEWSLGETHERPEWSWVALDADNSVVGYALNTMYVDDDAAESEGWTTRLGVLEPWRHHGIGLALIVSSMHSFREAGLDGAGLGVDTGDPDSATRLLDRCGFAIQDRVVLYVRELSQ